MNTSIPLEKQLLATKFYVPVTSGTLISRPRLTTLLNESLQYPLTLVSAAAGFGKTTVLSIWSQSLPPSNPRIAWVSLDEEDNEPQLFWTYVLTALGRQEPQRFTPLLTQLQSPQAPPLKYLLAELINLLMEGTEHFLLILDDYHVITEQQVHSSLSYLIEHLPPHLRIIVATRTDPPLPLSLLRVRGQTLEVRTDQLRCTPEETRAFFNEVMSIQLPEETIELMRTRTEGWLVGLHLLGLSLPGDTDPTPLLQEVSGDQRYILDYLTQEVLRRQSQDIQTFLLSTCILERLTASLCNAVMDQTNSQHILHQLEKANLFVVSLDSKRQWYRYHALFAEALHHRLEQTSGDLVHALHHRASLWYAEHDQTTQAILHAFQAKEWERVADLIEPLPVGTLSWGANEHELVLIREWLQKLPADIVHSRPRLCLTCAQMLLTVASPSMLRGWISEAETKLTVSLSKHRHEDVSYPMLTSQTLQEQENLLGEVIAWRALVSSYQEDATAILKLCQRALALLSAGNPIRGVVTLPKIIAYYTSDANDAATAIECGIQGYKFVQMAVGLGSAQVAAVVTNMSMAAEYMVVTGRLHEAMQLTQQAMLLGTQSGELVLPESGNPALFQAEILRERNLLDDAQDLILEAISLCKQIKSLASLSYVAHGYAVLLRVSLSRGELKAAYSALEEFERIGTHMNRPIYLHMRSLFTTIDQIKLWLACGELERATRWVEELDLGERDGTPFAHEREEVACARVLLARIQPDLVLQRLEPVLQRAATGQRWGHVIEIRLLQALAYQMHQQETQALDALSEAVQLGEPEGYIRSFVDEGTLVEALLYQLRKRDCKSGPTPYLDTLLTAFQQESKAHVRMEELTKAQALPEPLSDRELEVLQLLAQGASNLEIAQELVIVIDTVKRHVSHIFSKLGVHNRVQAVRQARELGLLDDEH